MNPPGYTHLQVGDRRLFELAMSKKTGAIYALLAREKPRGPSGELEVYENKQLPRNRAVLIETGEPPRTFEVYGTQER